MPIDTFEGKTAFITGGASGIGLGIAKVLAGRGARVVLADLRQDHIDHALAGFAGGERSNAVSALQLDVTNREAYREAAARMEREFGGIDILVNNAGVGLEGPILEATQNIIGAVTGIQGLRWFTVEVLGQGAHAGTTPRHKRRDAFSAAVGMIAALGKME